MDRGIVMEVTRRSAVIMTGDGQFVKMRVRPGMMIGQEVVVGVGDGQQGRSAKVGMYRRTAMAVAAVLLCLISLSVLAGRLQHEAGPLAAAYVSIDINPSVELGIDEQSVVVEATGWNAAGRELLQDVDVLGRELEDVTEELILRAEPYLESYRLTGQGEIFIASTIMFEGLALDQLELQERVKAVVYRVLMETLVDQKSEEGAKGTDGSGVESGDVRASSDAKGGNQEADGLTGGGKASVDGIDSDHVGSNTGSSGTEGQTEGGTDGTDQSGAAEKSVVSPIKVTTIPVTKEVREDAKKKGLSAGRFAVGLMVSEKVGHALTVKEVEKKSLRELTEKAGGLDEILKQDQDQLKSNIERLYKNSVEGKHNIGIVGKKNDEEKRSSNGGKNGGKKSDDDDRRGNAGRGNGGDSKSDGKKSDADDRRGNAGRGNGGGTKGSGKKSDDDDDRRGNAGRGNGGGSKSDGKNSDDDAADRRGNAGRGNGGGSKSDGKNSDDDDRRGNAGRGNGGGTKGSGKKSDTDDDRRGNAGRGNGGDSKSGGKNSDDDAADRRVNAGRDNPGGANSSGKKSDADDDRRVNAGRDNPGGIKGSGKNYVDRNTSVPGRGNNNDENWRDYGIGIWR